METIGTDEPLVKIVPTGTSPTPYSPFWTKESNLGAAVNSGKNLSEHFGLPIVSEAASYDVYRITPKVPTQVFVNTVAPTSELGGLVTKPGGAEQSLVPNRRLFNDPVHVRTVGNTLDLVASVERGGLSSSLVRGTGALGAVVVAIDATHTASRTVDLLHQGNTAGAASQVEHFGGRHLGALGGAALGAEIFGTVGVETGPVDLLIGGAGAVMGAVAGDRIADAYDRHKICNQPDAHGTTWHYDPGHPQRGWTRTVPTGELDADAMRFSQGMPVYRTRMETASPELAARLIFQADNTAVELALAHPARPSDPHTQPAGPGDTRSVIDASWTRDPHTRQWSRTVTDAVMEHGLKSTHVETAAPARAAELDAAARHTMANNLAASPRGIAQRYQALYRQHDWQRQGPMPDAVRHALDAPANTLQASDGRTYTHHRNGQWVTPGRFWGRNAAEGNLRDELDTTARMAGAASRSPQQVVDPPAVVARASASRQASTSPDHAPAQTLAPGAATLRKVPDHLRDFRHAGHPMHDAYARVLASVHAMETQARVPHGPHSERVAAALTARVHAQNIGKDHRDMITDVLHIAICGKDPRQDIVATVRVPGPAFMGEQRSLSMPLADALATSPTQSAETWSRRVLPHLHAAQAPVEDTARPDPERWPAHDPRAPGHPAHARFEAWRSRVADMYASVGLSRTGAQLYRVASAVMLEAGLRQLDDGREATLSLCPGRHGAIGPQSEILVQAPSSGLMRPTVAVVSQLALQQSAEQNLRQSQAPPAQMRQPPQVMQTGPAR